MATGGAKARRADAEQRLRRYQAAIGAGVDPVALVEVINQAQAERAAAQAEIDNAPARATLDPAGVYAMIDALDDIGATIGDAKLAGLARLYRELNIGVKYEPAERAVYLTAEPRVDSSKLCPRGDVHHNPTIMHRADAKIHPYPAASSGSRVTA